jgi:hypothetical protein
VNAINQLICRVIGHRWKQRRDLRIEGFLTTSPIRCRRCDALAPQSFRAGRN